MPLSKHTIVYAEDDLDDVFIVRQAFEKHDHITVVHSLNGQEALRVLENMARQDLYPCLVILDINMPVMNGRDALQAIRNHPKLNKLEVVLFTTSNSPADVAFAHSLNATLVTKPIEYTDLQSIALTFVDKCNFQINKLKGNQETI